mmetsp:Transcript_82444/g.260223  ORF Transcript_82444/g.260223 Transcript_82444/m.260223 type:complete len:229 (+) Transcript_82444:80-766(+)
MDPSGPTPGPTPSSAPSARMPAGTRSSGRPDPYPAACRMCSVTAVPSCRRAPRPPSRRACRCRTAWAPWREPRCRARCRTPRACSSARSPPQQPRPLPSRPGLAVQPSPRRPQRPWAATSHVPRLLRPRGPRPPRACQTWPARTRIFRSGWRPWGVLPPDPRTCCLLAMRKVHLDGLHLIPRRTRRLVAAPSRSSASSRRKSTASWSCLTTRRNPAPAMAAASPKLRP